MFSNDYQNDVTTEGYDPTKNIDKISEPIKLYLPSLKGSDTNAEDENVTNESSSFGLSPHETYTNSKTKSPIKNFITDKFGVAPEIEDEMK